MRLFSLTLRNAFIHASLYSPIVLRVYAFIQCHGQERFRVLDPPATMNGAPESGAKKDTETQQQSALGQTED